MEHDTHALRKGSVGAAAGRGPRRRLTARRLVLRDARWPPGTLVVAVLRGGETLFPTAATMLQAVDTLTILTDRSRELALRAYFERATPATPVTTRS
jgi:NhaP-type Na+/H+ and K+/H+ antiporter